MMCDALLLTYVVRISHTFKLPFYNTNASNDLLFHAKVHDYRFTNR